MTEDKDLDGWAGEKITGRVEVTSVRPDKPICTLLTTVRDEAGDICLSGRATAFTVALGALWRTGAMAALSAGRGATPERKVR